MGSLYFRVTFFSDSYRDTIQFSIYELTNKTAVVSLRHTPNLVEIYLNESQGEEEEPEFEVLAHFLIQLLHDQINSVIVEQETGKLSEEWIFKI